MHITTIERMNGVQVLALHGQLDIDTGAILRETLDLALDRPVPRIVIDLAGLDFCDSTGLSALLTGQTAAAGRGGWLRLAAPSPFLARVLHTVGITGHTQVYANVLSAAVDESAG